MASSSSSSLLSTPHDVFLSFRGEDTRYNFVSHLAKDLRNLKIQAFVDDDLMRDHEISPTLIRGIQLSKISIIVFSENYAGSKWCLDELVKILNCREAQKQIVIPVFYKVDPTNVRNQTGQFGTAFDRLLEEIPLSKLLSKEQIWRNALKSAANISWFHSFNTGLEATLIENIIAVVLEKLKTGYDNTCDYRGLVGINPRVHKIMHLLDIVSPEIRTVGIWGMGGIGKTTIALEVFNLISLEFESSCFVGNVREKEKREGLPSMRNNLISKLLKDKTLEVQTPGIGDASIKDRLRRTKVLVVLDDVDDSFQLEVLIGRHGTDHFGQGSRVMVTTRDKFVFYDHDVKHVYDMELLDHKEALGLCYYNALRPDQPIVPYTEILEKIVEYAHGVPLALKVLGSSFRWKNDIYDWEGEFKKLKKNYNLNFFDVFRIGYDSLDSEEKDIFLDIVCFFKDENMDKVRNVLAGFYVSWHSGIEALIDKSLINIKVRDEEFIEDSFINNTTINDWPWKRIRAETTTAGINVVEMHELIEEMGWNIVIEESKEVGSRSRIWRFEDAYAVLTQNRGTDKIKGILLDVNAQKVNQMNIDPQAFAKIYNLKFLKIVNSFPWNYKIEFPWGLEALPERLVYLEWEYYPLEYLPPTFNPTNLVELHLSGSRLKRLWSGTQNLCNLKVLNLQYSRSLAEISDLSLAKNLEKLNLRSCTALVKLSSSIQNCRSLKYLDLSTTGLRGIPSSIQHLENLTYLDLSGCYLKDIPSFVQHLTNLTYIDLSDCYLKDIPSFMKHLTNLTHLNLHSCINLSKIPPSIQHFRNLTHLNISYCTGVMKDLSSIPDLITHITKYPNFPKKIKFLEVDGILIEVYPSSIKPLTKLVELVLWNCSDYQMSSNILKELKTLTPQGCKIQLNGM